MLDSILEADEGPAAAADLRITVFRSVEAAEGIWREAEARGRGYAFQRYDWHAAWQATIGAAERVDPYIVRVVDAADATMLLLPLGVYRLQGLRVLRPLGGLVTDYNAPLLEPGFAAQVTPEQVAGLWSAILDALPRIDLVWLRRMPEMVEGARNPLVFLSGARHTEDAHTARLGPTMAQFRAEHTLSWPDTRRRRRRLSEQGRLEFVVAASPEKQHAMLQSLAPLKSRHWRRAGSRDWFAEPGYLRFYETLTAAPPPDVEVHVSALRVDDVVVAAHWGLVAGGRFYHLVTAYDDQWSRYAPGRLLIEDLVDWCIRRGDIRLFDFTAGAEPYKREWTDHSMPLYEVIAPRSALGTAYVTWRGWRERLKQQEQLRSLVRRLKGGKRG